LGSSSHNAIVTCEALAAQLPCIDPTPDEFSLAAGATQVVTVGYRTLGLGQFQQKIHVYDVQAAKDISQTFGLVTVVGVPIASLMNPLDSAEFFFYDTLRFQLSHPSGVNTNCCTLLIDNVNRTSQATISQNVLAAAASNLALTGGFHSLRVYACAVNGRCDSTATTTFFVSGNAASNLDDNLGPPMGDGLVGLLPGALPLPPTELRGCPLLMGWPMIKLSQPFSYIDQMVNPLGMMFRANVNFDTVIAITTTNHDYAQSDPLAKTCGSFTYLTPSQYAWNFWDDPVDTDPMWDSYPYGDFTPPGGGIGPMSITNPEAVAPLSPPTTSKPGINRSGNNGNGGGGGGVGILALPAGAMNPDSVRVWLNSTQIIQNGNAVPGKGVTIVSEDLVQYQYKVTVATGIAQGFVHLYNPANPLSDNGGWNELVLAAADSSGHWTQVRARFVQLQSYTVGPLAVTPLRDFRHQSQAECAAFGAFQCGGIMLVQAIPGFVTRDKDRGLHLMYRSASQRAKTVLPLDLFVSRVSRAPDSVNVSLLEGGVVVSDTQHYYGLKAIAGVADSNVLWENANERRQIGIWMPPPPGGTNAAIRTVTAWVRSFYGTSPGFQDDTVRQDATQLYLSDTTMSRFGPGWALAEQSRLITLNGATRRVWLAGDGSFVVFNKVGGIWLAPPGETGRLKDTTVSGAASVLFLDNGARVGYDALGWQLWTSDVIGNLTRFKYSASSQRLDSIVDPAGIRYEFVYSGTTTGQIAEIWIRGTGGATQKMASFNYDGSRRLTVAKIWRSATAYDSTVYGYHATAPGAYITSVTDPRSTVGVPIVSTLTYDTLYWLPTTIVRPPEQYGSASAQYRDPLRRAMPRAGRARTKATAERMNFSNWYKGTSVNFTARSTDFTVDRFGNPTLVAAKAPPAILTQDFLMIDWGGDDVRRIERDTTGRVTKIVRGDPGHLALDSVMYRYDPLGPVDTIIRNTLAYPVTTPLDTIVFTYDTARVSSTAGRCTRLLTMRDAMGGLTRTVYGASGAGQCLPIKTIGLAQDTTIFTYGSLSVGDSAGARPLSVRDPVGVTVEMRYERPTWNSAVGIRPAATDTSRMFYNAYGLVDSVRDGVGTRTRYEYDQSGRLLRSKIGTLLLAPTTATFYNRSGLTDSVRVYASDDGSLATPTGTVQTTKYFYNRLGWVDSMVYPGGRRQKFSRTRDGNPMYEYSGNGTMIGRSFDWKGRVGYEVPNQVGPDYRMSGDSFATRVADSIYRSLGVQYGITLSSGQSHTYVYDNKGNVKEIRSTDVGSGPGNLTTRNYLYSLTGQITYDSLMFVKDGLAVARVYQYNRRGQRTLALTRISVTNGSILERNDSLRYIYDSVTARLDSMVGRADSLVNSWRTYGAVKWLYDRASRDTLTRVTPWNAVAGTVLSTRTTYDAAGRPNLIATTKPGTTWYQFSAPSYNRIDELLGASLIEPPSLSSTMSYTYATNGTRRLMYGSLRTGTHNYTFDVFGNELNESRTSTFVPDCSGNGPDNTTFGPDNAIIRTLDSCSKVNRYWNDKAGNRLVRIDTTAGGSYDGFKSIMSYTAKNQLFFSMTPTAQVGTFDYNWHWYDATGMRVISQRTLGSTWIPGGTAPTGGRTFYVYDGSDMALKVVKTGTGAWSVRARYLTGGLDNNLAGRFQDEASAVTRNLTLVNDRLGSTLAAIRADGTLEPNATYFSRDPYGGYLGASGSGGTLNTETGFAGASTPNSSGGFVYLRNRWYDPKTGRFLTQDPIGLAGGINLYSYAGNNPVMFTDPFGLMCEKIHNTRAPCELFLAAFSEANPRHAESESRGIARAIINRAQDSQHSYGFSNTGSLDADIRGQINAPNQVQGRGNGEWNKLETLLSGGQIVFNPGDANKLGAVVRGVEAAYGNQTDPTNGSTYWDHSPSKAGQGASEKYCAPTATVTIGSANFAKCSK